MALVARLLPEVTDDDNYAALLAAQAHLLSLGITGWQDAIIGRMPGEIDATGAYLRAARAGTLRVNVVGAQWWDRDQGLEQLPELLHRRVTDGRFRATSVKMMLDGVAENHTAALLEPYLDGDRDGCAAGRSGSGIDFIDPAQLPGFVTALDREGFQVHFHAIGDRAVRHALDAVAAARARNGPAGGRHHLAHVQVVHPEDIRASPGSARPPTSSRCGRCTSRRWTSSPSRSSASAGQAGSIRSARCTPRARPCARAATGR